MSQTTVVKSFADLPQLLNLDDLPPGPDEAVEEPASPPAIPDNPIDAIAESEATIDLGDLLAELEAASATLAAVARQDAETRSLALRDLERYDALAATLYQAEQAHDRARELHGRAQSLADQAFASEARDAAVRV